MSNISFLDSQESLEINLRHELLIFGLEVRIPACITGQSLRSILVRPRVGPIVVRACMLRGIPLEWEELSSTNRNEIQTLCPH